MVLLCDIWKRLPLGWLIGMSAACLCLILCIGLWPKDFSLSDRISWIDEPAGIRFHPHGIAYTDPLIRLPETSLSGSNAFSFEIALKPANPLGKGFNFVFALHNGQDSEQLVMGQYRSWIILMNGDDYPYKRRIQRITLDTAPWPPTPRLLAVTAGQDGTEVYLDGQLVHSKRDFTLKTPPGAKSRLLLGNSIYNRHSWTGAVHGLAFFGYPLTAQTAALHFDQWSKKRNFSFAKKEKPALLYLFDENHGTDANDHSGNQLHLKIPSGSPVLKKEFFGLSGPKYEFDRSSVVDIIINFFGFIPFGFVLTATFIKRGGKFVKQALPAAVGICFMASLSIEVIQAWMPSRSSDLLDLASNTLGALMGAVSCGLFNAWVDHRQK